MLVIAVHSSRRPTSGKIRRSELTRKGDLNMSNLLKSTWGVFATSLLVLSLSSCALLGPSEEEIQLEADCVAIFENAADSSEWDDDVDLDTWPETYAVTNAGVASRQKARIDVNQKFPWIEGAVSEMVQVHGWEKLEESSYILEPYIEALAINELVQGSSAAPVFDSTLIARILNAEPDSSQLVDAYWAAVYDRYEPSFLSDCPEITSDSYVDGFDERVSETISNARKSGEQMLTIISCETRGVFDGDDCAAEDFRSGASSTAVERRNPFEYPFSDATTQGIAEFAWCWDLGLEVRPDRLGCW